ncbi:MAG: hypothetical protein WB781_13230 [Candidatus Sulfotelmatobacter sp.]
MIHCLWLLLLTVWLWGQPPSASEREKTAIQLAKSQLVSSFDRSLPRVSLEFFLKYEGGGATIKWEVNDCGEQAGNPAIDHRLDSPVCVEADFDKDHATVTVVVSVGTFKTGPLGAPALVSVTITDRSGLIRPVHHLSDLPMELHRPIPSVPRNIPVQVGALSSLPPKLDAYCFF